jgi:ATP-dependent Clp protease protease subunit
MNNLILPESRYVLPSFEERTSYGFKTTNPYTKLFEERVVFVGAPIDDTVADDVMAQLLVLEGQDAERDIVMYINSPGGSFTALTAIYDTMKFIRPHIQTICLGQASSAAAILLAAGEKGKRMALPNARIMIHQPAMSGERGQASDIEIQAAEALRVRIWIENALHKDTGRSVEMIHNDIERDKFLTADEALEYGIIDSILSSRKK